MKEAMKAKDTVRLGVIRGLSAAFTNELVSQKRAPDAELSDEDALTVIKRAAKQRKDSIEQFEKGGRPELAADEKAELEIIEEFLPAQMSKDEIRPIAEKKLTEMGVTDKSGMGKAMGAIMAELGGNADGTDVKEVVEEILS